jgi:hypothetical protein
MLTCPLVSTNATVHDSMYARGTLPESASKRTSRVVRMARQYPLLVVVRDDFTTDSHAG